MSRVVDLSGGEPVPPGGKPIPGRTNLADVEWALTRARRFIFKGGDPALALESRLRLAASPSRAGLTASDSETVISTAPNQAQTQAVTPLAKESDAVSPSGAEGAEG